MSASIRVRVALAISLILATLASFALPPTAVTALGTPQISSVRPGSGAPVGTTVCIRATISWDNTFRSMRIRFGNSGWNESSETNFERCFSTQGYAPGSYTIRVEAARLGDNNWSSPTVAEQSYYLSPAVNPAPTSTPTALPRTSLNSSPGSVQAGQNVNVSWANLQATGNDWISMHPVNTPDSSYLSWQYARGSSGSLTFSSPRTNGSYEFRLFRNGQKVATSNAFRVGTVSPYPGPNASPTPVPQRTYQPQARVASIQRVGDCQWNVTVEVTGLRPGSRLTGTNYYDYTDCQGNRRSGSYGPYDLGVADDSGRNVSVHPQYDFGSYSKTITDSDGHQLSVQYSYDRNYPSRATPQPQPSGSHRSTIIASYQAAFGRDPSGDELQYWLGATGPDVTVDSLVGWHMGWLRGAYDERVAMVGRAFRAAFGRSPSSEEVDRWQAIIQNEGLPYRSLVPRVASDVPSDVIPSGNLVHCGPNAGNTISGCSANGEYGDGGDDASWRAADWDLNTQWSSRERLNSWWQASFSTQVRVSQVAIWGRGGGDNISGRLEFSDGSSVGFGSLNPDGCRRAQSFSSRVTTFIRFRVTGMGNRDTTGFRELEAYANPRYPDGDDCGGSTLPPSPPPGGTQTGGPQTGQIFGLNKGTQIRTGPGFQYPSTIPAQWGSAVPEDNWMVFITEGPICSDGWNWWNIDRRAAGDPNGGTGWAAISQGCSSPAQPPPVINTASGVQLCQHINYRGLCETFSGDDPDLRDNNIGNDSASSLRVPSGQIVALYGDVNYTGRCQGFNSDTPSLLGSYIGNDSASSIRIGAGCTVGPPSPPPSGSAWAQRLDNIRQAYRDILGREADDAGLNNYAYSGLSISQVRDDLLMSNECRQGLGGRCAELYRQPPQPPQAQQLGRGCSESADSTVTCTAVGVVAGPEGDPYIGVFELPRDGASDRILQVRFRARAFFDLYGTGHCGSLPEFDDVRGNHYRPNPGFEFVQGCVRGIERVPDWTGKGDPTLWELTYRK